MTTAPRVQAVPGRGVAADPFLCLFHRDERQRDEALLTVARYCRVLGSRLVFAGTEAACERARRSLRELDAEVASQIAFRSAAPAPDEDEPTGGAPSGARGPIVAWIELPTLGAADAIGAAIRQQLRAFGFLDAAALAAIGAVPLADVSEAKLQRLLDANVTLVHAAAVAHRCPPSLIGHLQGARLLTGMEPTAADAGSGPDLERDDLSRHERLVATGQMAAELAHELGNALSIISSSLQYLHQHLAAGDPISDFTSVALDNVERMDSLLRGMLNLSAVKRSELKEANLNLLISETLRFTAGPCAQRGVAVDVSFAPDFPPLRLDPQGIRHLVLNLVKNSLEALAGHQGGSITVRTRVDAERAAGRMEIENNGPPIPDDVLPHVFRPFFTTKDGGTGLGLYLCRRIAKEHRGTIDVRNLEGGVCFTVTFPFERPA